MQDDRQLLTRRHFLGRSSTGIGVAALASLLHPELLAGGETAPGTFGGLADLPHFCPRAKHVIFLFQSGAPSQIDLFDPKPELRKRHGHELPESVRMGQQLTTMTSDQSSKPLTASLSNFRKRGNCGMELSDLLPYTANVVDDICLIRSMATEAINHDPAITFFQTGSQQPGRPGMGAWVSYGIGSETANLPTFVVFASGGEPRDQPLFGRLWGAGFLPPKHQGTRFRGNGDPVLYLNNPPGVSVKTRRRMLDGLSELNQIQADEFGDPAIESRIEQYELAYRMQTSVPELVDLSSEPEHVFKLYGDDSRKPGTFAANCLLARRLVERGVRFVQLFHRGWDHHENLPMRLPVKCKQTDQASAALVQDLKRRGLLNETLVVWCGEFGRTAYCQGTLFSDNFGRDHHPRCFSIWMAGGGVKGGLVFGETDEFSYNGIQDRVHVHDLQATILHCLGIDHKRLTFRSQGRDFRLTDIHGNVVKKILA